MTNPLLPNGSEVLLSMEEKMKNMLSTHIQDANSPLAILFANRREFDSEIELRAHLQECLANMWDSLAHSFQDLGFPNNSRLHQTHGKKEWQEYIRRFSEWIFAFIEPALERVQGKILLELDQNNIDKILTALTKQISNTRHGTPLPAGHANISEWAALSHIRWSLAILPNELRAYTAEAWLTTPVTSAHQIYEEGSVMKIAKTGLMTTTIAFMTYGIHGLINTWVTKLAEAQPNQLDNTWSSLLQSPTTYGTMSWGISVVAAYTVGSMLLKPAEKIRENLIKAGDSGKNVSALRAVGSSKFAALALAVPITFGVIDAAGIFNREAEGYIVGHVAYQTKEKLWKILNIKDPSSPIGQANAQYDKMTNMLTVFSREFVAAEAARPGASGQWPAYKAKEFILKWDRVLTDPILAREPSLMWAVEKASRGLNTINAQNHADYPWLPEKAKRVQAFFESRTSNLIDGYSDPQTGAKFDGINSFDPMIEMNKHGPLYHFIGQIPWLGSKIYKSHDLALLQWQFGDEARDYRKSLEVVNTSWWARSGIYQTYIQEVSDIADAKYKSRTSITIPGSIPVPDMSGLTAALGEKPPKISALWPQASYEQLQKITDQPGGIKKWDFDTLVAFSLIRPFALEFASLSLIIAWLFSMARYYRNPKNSLGTKKEELTRSYNALVHAVEQTFSGETWQALFPGHAGITEQEAEYIVREIATDMHPELLDFFPSVHKSLSKPKKTLAKWLTFLKNIHQWNTRTSDESYVLSLSQALEKMGYKSNGNIGINSSTIKRIFERIIPGDKLTWYTMD